MAENSFRQSRDVERRKASLKSVLRPRLWETLLGKRVETQKTYECVCVCRMKMKVQTFLL